MTTLTQKAGLVVLSTVFAAQAAAADFNTACMGVYVQDNATGQPLYGKNETARFKIASLSKVPTSLAVLQLGARVPDELTVTLPTQWQTTFGKKGYNPQSPHTVFCTQPAGQKITVSKTDLLKNMLAISNNTAAVTAGDVVQNLFKTSFGDVIRKIGERLGINRDQAHITDPSGLANANDCRSQAPEENTASPYAMTRFWNALVIAAGPESDLLSTETVNWQNKTYTATNPVRRGRITFPDGINVRGKTGTVSGISAFTGDATAEDLQTGIHKQISFTLICRTGADRNQAVKTLVPRFLAQAQNILPETSPMQGEIRHTYTPPSVQKMNPNGDGARAALVSTRENGNSRLTLFSFDQE